MEAGGADPLGRGFPLIQVCAEGERGGQKTVILQLLLPMEVVAPRFVFGDIFFPIHFSLLSFRHFWPRTG